MTEKMFVYSCNDESTMMMMMNKKMYESDATESWAMDQNSIQHYFLPAIIFFGDSCTSASISMSNEKIDCRNWLAIFLPSHASNALTENLFPIFLLKDFCLSWHFWLLQWISLSIDGVNDWNVWDVPVSPFLYLVLLLCVLCVTAI